MKAVYRCVDCGQRLPCDCPENVETPLCATCEGMGAIRAFDQRHPEPCPDCTPENVESLDHDHILQCNGIDQGFPMWDLLCVHDTSPKFYTDTEGEEYDDCLVQSWWENEGIDIIHSTDPRYDNDPPGLAVITTYLEGGEPLLRSYANAKDWKEGLEY